MTKIWQGSNSVLVYMNGTTDYVEAFAYQESGGSASINTNAGLTMFSGFMVRAA